MKSLNKKISAIVLAGMVVMGGVLSSGVSSFAAVAKNVSVQGHQYKQVENLSKQYGKIIAVDKEEKNLEGKYNKSKCYNNGRKVIIKNPYEIPKHLVNANRYKKEFVKIEFSGFYYLIKLN